jgi:hypothetical protein
VVSQIPRSCNLIQKSPRRITCDFNSDQQLELDGKVILETNRVPLPESGV